jgi:hypothetical protein
VISARSFHRLYWFTRIGIAIIWLWTAYVSWYVHPHAESLALLRRSGMVHYTGLVFGASCLLDLAMGFASLIYARSCIWWIQFALVASYSVIIGVMLPEYLFHPFGEISKNLSVLACLALLATADRRQP